MKKQLALGIALATAATCSFADWAPKYLSGQYTSTVTYGALGQSATPVTYAEQMDATGHAKGPLGAFADMALTLQPELLGNLNEASAGAAGSTTFTGGTLTGALNVYMAAPLTGATGVNHVSMTGPTYKATYTTSGTKYLIHYTCTINATMAQLEIDGSYNTVTSQLDAAQTKLTFTPQSSASCSSSIDWLPIIGDWANRIVTGAANKATLAKLSSFEGHTLQALLGSSQYVGFNPTIPSGAFMFAGKDMGAYIKNNSATLFGAPGTFVNMTIGVPQAEGLTGAGSYVPPFDYTNTEFAITFGSFAGTLSYQVASARHYTYVWKAPHPIEP